eukprot:TRINITY_DN8366_c0_g1_i1.p1 TRINITY_DN8366_c0_g1~~TRINITY_DN8366_c0_g1_i1.p1  ORF type:complete len:1302 (-),score=320.47 TRINITY_DN8366_c0_g1_i1:377-4282(-)
MYGQYGRRKNSTLLAARYQGAWREQEAAPQQKSATVTLTKHRELPEWPVLCLGKDLESVFSKNALLRLTCKEKPAVKLFIRALPSSFLASARGVSALSTIAGKASLAEFGDEEVQLLEVEEKEAKLQDVTIVLFDRYLSKRDLWQLHLAMMQEPGEILYAGHNRNFREHLAENRIERLSLPGEGNRPPLDAISGAVGVNTELTFKSGSSSVFVLVQVSAELLSFSPTGKPYWERLLECLRQLVDKSLKLESLVGVGDGHFLCMVLFGRALREGGRCPCGGASLPQKYDDFYEVFFEGFARTLPPTERLIGRVRELFLWLHEDYQLQGVRDGPQEKDRCREQAEAAGEGRRRAPSKSAYSKARLLLKHRARDLVEAKEGNVLECLNLALDHFDQYHLDRPLKVTGQMMVMLTAGSGLISSSRNLYDLTCKRFESAGPSAEVPLRLLSVRQPPLHVVPLVEQLEEPLESCPLSSSGQQCRAEETQEALTPGKANGEQRGHGVRWGVPKWCDVSFFPEDGFYRKEGAEFLNSNALPLDACGMAVDAEPTYRGAHSPKRLGPEAGSAAEAGGAEVDAAAAQGLPLPDLALPPRGSPEPPKRVDEGLWADIRTPQLRPYLKRIRSPVPAAAPDKESAPRILWPSRFNYTDEDSERVNTMQDLVGLRLESRTSQLLEEPPTEEGESQPNVFKFSGGGGDEVPAPEAVAAAGKTAWKNQAQLQPRELRRKLRVQAASGDYEWIFEPKENGLFIKDINYKASSSSGSGASVLKHHYNDFYVRRRHILSDRSEATGLTVGSGSVLEITGCADAALRSKVLGTYTLQSQSHGGRRAYKRDAQVDGRDVMLYFWEKRDSPNWGWCVGPEAASGEQVWAYHSDARAQTPPMSGWKVPLDGPVDVTFAISPKRVGGAAPAAEAEAIAAAAAAAADGPGEDDETDDDDDVDVLWSPCNRIFHLPTRPRFDDLDEIIAGNHPMPPTIPYPIESTRPRHSRFDGWQLRNSVKQHLYVLVPDKPLEWLHDEHFASVVKTRQEMIETGVDTFELLEKEHDRVKGKGLDEMRAASLENFEKFLQGLQDLCFGGNQDADNISPTGGRSEKGLKVELVRDGTRFYVKSSQTTVYARSMDIPSAFRESRDWFELFYDNIYSPPRPFVFVLQWIVCSTMHLVNFQTSLRQLASKTKFKLLRLPISQLFPQPAPTHVQSDVRETNFCRLAFHSPQKLAISAEIKDDDRKRLNAKLLESWLRHPLNCLFIFASDVERFLVQDDFTDTNRATVIYIISYWEIRPKHRSTKKRQTHCTHLRVLVVGPT